MEIVFEGDLSRGMGMREVLRRICDEPYKGSRILQLTANSGDFLGLLAISDARFVSGASTYGSLVPNPAGPKQSDFDSGYTALRYICAIKEAHYAFLNASSDELAKLKPNLNIELEKLLPLLPHLPKQLGHEFDEKSLLDKIFGDAENVWSQMPPIDLSNAYSGQQGAPDQTSFEPPIDDGLPRKPINPIMSNLAAKVSQMRLPKSKITSASQIKIPKIEKVDVADTLTDYVPSQPVLTQPESDLDNLPPIKLSGNKEDVADAQSAGPGWIPLKVDRDQQPGEPPRMTWNRIEALPPEAVERKGKSFNAEESESQPAPTPAPLTGSSSESASAPRRVPTTPLSSNVTRPARINIAVHDESDNSLWKTVGIVSAIVIAILVIMFFWHMMTPDKHHRSTSETSMNFFYFSNV